MRLGTAQRLIVAFCLSTAAACASTGGQGTTAPSARVSDGPVSGAPPSLPKGAMPGYVIHVSQLTPATLATDALDPQSLDALLSQAGLQAGTETRFTARGRRLTEVVARALRFSSPSGAATYLDWLRTHMVDLLGARTTAALPPDLPGAIAVRHGPNGCCTKDTFQYFAAWTRGAYVLTLRVGGPGAARRSAEPLASRLDASVR